ncbi:response regulator [Christensenellaceae bacterium OttesenSCG-928-M15]|nr:response regulator [Christensenellaceae bacterium OttesenSCG-928-M15]
MAVNDARGNFITWYGTLTDKELEKRFHIQDISSYSAILRRIVLIEGLLYAALVLFDLLRLGAGVGIAFAGRLSVLLFAFAIFIFSKRVKDKRKLTCWSIALVAYTAVEYLIVAIHFSNASYMMICLSVITFIVVLFLMQARWAATNIVAAAIILVFFIATFGRYSLMPAEQFAALMTIIATTAVVSLIYLRMCRAKRVQYYHNMALEKQNESLEEQIEHRTEILNIVNQISTILLGSQVESFDKSLLSCMEKLGVSMGVDRVYIWENHMEGDELYCTQIYEWSGEAEPQQGNDLTVSVPFPDAWYPNLSVNQCVNGIVDHFPEYEREHLKAQGIVSIIVVPVYLYDQFWGFVGFDDCEKARLFTSAEESILRTASLLFGHAYVRNATTVDLVVAKEEAMANAKAKTDFLANMSHEIRTPINAITGMVSVAGKTDDKAEISRCLNNIDGASRQLLSIINDVLDMSKISAGKMELANVPFRLEAILERVESIIGAQAAEKNLRFSTETKGQLPAALIGDDTRLAQVLINLLSNAVKFTQKGGSVRLITEYLGQEEQEELEFAKLRFSVIDTGIGIPAEQIDSLFVEFEQADRSTSRKYGGTGLGLTISQSLARLMNGNIDVESEVGAGSRFTLSVCIRKGAPGLLEPTGDELVEEQYDFTGRRALLVEDIEINREIVKAMLAEYGLDIVEAENGEIALQVFKNDPEQFDIIFMDIQMPVMDGYVATGQIRALPYPNAKRIPIIAMTANAFAEDVQKCLEAGMNDHISKPIDFVALKSTIAKHLLV